MTIYLDNAASTPVEPAVVDAMLPHLQGAGANPSATHAPGCAAGHALETARERVAGIINAVPREIVWTGGATEANNLAIQGVAAYQREPGHIITVNTEHRSVLGPIQVLESRGWRVTRLSVDDNGRVTPEQVADALTPKTALVSVMHVNNETGVIQDIAAIGAVVREHEAAFHVDAAQSIGKLALDVDVTGADLVSLSAHKVHGPKGIGALYLRSRPAARVTPVVFGGGHERSYRPGTPATHQVVGMAEALALAATRRAEEQKRIGVLRDRLWTRIAALPGVCRNGSTLNCAPGILNASFEDVHGEALHAALAGSEPSLAVASGSACASAGAESSYVLRALGRSAAQAASSVRFSLGRFTTEADVSRAGEVVVSQVERLRAMAPHGDANTAAA